MIVGVMEIVVAVIVAQAVAWATVTATGAQAPLACPTR
jgi:hypothetical protein